MLTRRRLEFLIKLDRLSGPDSHPVHYKTVAKAIGVSKWTAYDVMRELERMELVEVCYQRADGRAHRPGRAQVCYVPSPQGRRLAQDPAEAALGSLDLLNDWHQTKEWLLRIMGASERGVGAARRRAIEQVLRQVPQVRRGLIRSAYLATVLLLQCQGVSRSGLARVRALIEASPRAEMALGVFAGAAGSVVERAASLATVGNQSAHALVGRLEQAMARLSRDEVRVLADFLREALTRTV